MGSRTLNRLSARTVQTVKDPGMLADGGGLYLVIDPRGTKRWTFVFQWEGKRKEFGLGSAKTVSLSDARDAALKARKLVQGGVNPILDRRHERGAVPTFGAVADDLVADLTPQWDSPKTAHQWTMTMTVYAKALREMPVDQVDTTAVLKILNPIWNTIPETASRTRMRIERVLDAAKARGYRTGENAARWRGHLALLLPNRQRLSRGHHSSVPIAEMGAFMANLRGRPAMSGAALEFTILTAARTGETLGATWGEIDADRTVWSIPGERMKAGKSHRVPLSARAVAILAEVAEARPCVAGAFIFPRQDGKGQLSSMSMAMLMRRMGYAQFTVHGFRSTFRDWVGEWTEFPSELAEAALAHAVGSQVERAYRRGDALERRRGLMDAWAEFCTTPLTAP